jgi:hypothetical protein
VRKKQRYPSEDALVARDTMTPPGVDREPRHQRLGEEVAESVPAPKGFEPRRGILQPGAADYLASLDLFQAA